MVRLHSADSSFFSNYLHKYGFLVQTWCSESFELYLFTNLFTIYYFLYLLKKQQRFSAKEEVSY